MQQIFMRKSLGFVITLYAITQMLSEPFKAFEHATTATFQTVEVAAVMSKLQLIDLTHR